MGFNPRWLCWLLLLLLSLPAPAQLAKNFYFINKIEHRVLPNAVQVTIRTDGVAQFGADINEFLDLDDRGVYKPKAVEHLRLRFVRGRTKIDAFSPIGVYPVDAAVASPGRDELQRPYLSAYGAPGDPLTDIDIRFYVPVKIMRFNPFGGSGSVGRNTDDADDSGFNFSDVLGPLEVGVELGRDRRSVTITIMSDRVDALREPSLHRSAGPFKTRLSIRATETAGQFRCDLLHAPLDRVLDAASRAFGVPLVQRGEISDVSLLLPATTQGEFLDALCLAYNLEAAPLPDGGFTIGRGGELDVTANLTLNHLTPDHARRLFPDFLLPRLRSDEENNALVATGSARLVERITRDVAVLDQPRPQVAVEVGVWEVRDEGTLQAVLRGAQSRGGELGGKFNLDSGEAALVIDGASARAITASLGALKTTTRARLVDTPRIQVASGETGTLFSGQTRYITVLRRRRGQQNVETMQLQVGTTLTVTPQVAGGVDGAEILLKLNPVVSSVDGTDAVTGLPILALRQVETTVRVRPDDTVIIAGLNTLFDDSNNHGLLAAGPAKRTASAHTSLIFIVTARRVP